MLTVRPIPRVLSRHNHILGGERNLVLVSALACGGVGLASANTVGIVTCAVLWVASLQAWRWTAKADPQLSGVYIRSLKYRGYYPAFSRPYRETETMTAGHYVAAVILSIIAVYIWWRLI